MRLKISKRGIPVLRGLRRPGQVLNVMQEEVGPEELRVVQVTESQVILC
jgi:hypothetical protein